MKRPRKPPPLLVGPMRPLVEGGTYDPLFHTFEVLRAAGLGASFDELTVANSATFVPRLVPMKYEGAP